MNTFERLRSVEHKLRSIAIVATIVTVGLMDSWSSEAHAETPSRGKAKTVESGTAFGSTDYYRKLLNGVGYEADGFQLLNVQSIAKQCLEQGINADSALVNAALDAVQFKRTLEDIVQTECSDEWDYFNAYQEVLKFSSEDTVSSDSTQAFKIAKDSVAGKYKKTNHYLYLRISSLKVGQVVPKPHFKGLDAYKLPPKPEKPVKKTATAPKAKRS